MFTISVKSQLDGTQNIMVHISYEGIEEGLDNSVPVNMSAQETTHTYAWREDEHSHYICMISLRPPVCVFCDWPKGERWKLIQEALSVSVSHSTDRSLHPSLDRSSRRPSSPPARIGCAHQQRVGGDTITPDSTRLLETRRHPEKQLLGGGLALVSPTWQHQSLKTTAGLQRKTPQPTYQ